MAFPMSKRVWCNLPDVLLERILPRLPVSSLLRFRCVCKSWNSYILSPSFFQQCSDISSSGYGNSSLAHSAQRNSHQDVSYLLLSTWSQEFPLLAFNPSQETWHRPSLDFLNGDELEFSVVSASRGLVCLSDCEGTFLVCNPVTKAKRKINMVCTETGKAMLWNIVSTNLRTFKDEGRTRFELVCVGSCKSCKQATCVYDSLKDQWSISRENREIHFFEGNGVFHGSDLMAVTSYPFKLIVFNKVSSAWHEHGASFPPHILFPCLVENTGSLMLLAAVDEVDEAREKEEGAMMIEGGKGEGLCAGLLGSNREVESGARIVAFKLWKLDEEVNSWIETASVPDEMLSKILKSGCFEGFSCVAQRDMVYLSSSEGCIVYDSSSQTWRWLPQSQVLLDLHACIKDVYALEPTLDNVLVCKSPSPVPSVCAKAYCSSLWSLPSSSSLSC